MNKYTRQKVVSYTPLFLTSPNKLLPYGEMTLACGHTKLTLNPLQKRAKCYDCERRATEP